VNSGKSVCAATGSAKANAAIAVMVFIGFIINNLYLFQTKLSKIYPIKNMDSVRIRLVIDN
jgi:hypothetical protein